MVIGSGPIIIGQAAEFDYAGVQACRALREEGHRVILVNSNPATIMTDPEIADAVYLEPLTVLSLERIIARERPDALLPTLGGQTGLNLAVELAEAGVIDKYGVELLGTPLDTARAITRSVRDAVLDLVDGIEKRAPIDVSGARERVSAAVLVISLLAFGNAMVGAQLAQMLGLSAEAARSLTASLLANLLAAGPDAPGPLDPPPRN